MGINLPNNGLETPRTNATKHWQYFTVRPAIDDDPDATITYTPGGGTGSSAGAVNVTSHAEEISVEWDLDTLASTSIELRLEGRFGGSPGWTLLHTESLTAVNDDNSHGSVTIEEAPEAFRVGKRAIGDVGGDVISIWIRGRGRIE